MAYYIHRLNLPKLGENKPLTAKAQKELENTLNVFNTAGSRKQKKDITEWGVNRDDVINRMFTIYLFSKYGMSCPIFESVSIDRVGISLDIHLFKKNNFTFTPSEFTKKYLKQIHKCMKGGEKVVICPIRLIFEKSAHANLIIFRKDSRTIEVFEPHGKEYGGRNVSAEKVFDAYRKIGDLFNKTITDKSKHYTLLLSNNVCPINEGFQALEGRSFLPKHKLEGGGYCAVWSSFMTELILMNPQLSTNQIILEALKIAEAQSKDGKVHDYMLELVRGYATYITRRLEKYYTLIFGETAMKAIRTGNRKASREERRYAKKMFNAYAYVTNKLAIDKKATLESIQSYVKEQNKLPTVDKKLVLQIIEAMKDEKYGKYSVPGHHTPGMINSIVKKDPCPPGKVHNEKGNCVKPKSKTQKNTVKNTQLSKTRKVSLNPCPPGKERNPQTGRCRKIQVPEKITKTVKAKSPKKTKKVTINSSPKKLVKLSTPKKNAKLLKPCPAGKERNPKTGRCRKIPVPKKNAKTKKVTLTCPPGCMIDTNYNRT